MPEEGCLLALLAPQIVKEGQEAQGLGFVNLTLRDFQQILPHLT